MQTDIEKYKETQLQLVKDKINAREQTIKTLLTENGVDYNVFQTKLQLVISKNPNLMLCFESEMGQDSLFGAILTCAGLGFIPNDITQFASIIPYNESVKYKDKKGIPLDKIIPCARLEIGYQGWLELCRRTDLVASIDTAFIDETEVDSLEIIGGTNKSIKWIVNARGEKNNPVGFYARINFKDGTYSDKYLTKEQVKKIRDPYNKKTNQNVPDPLYNMSIKTVLKQITKFMPKSAKDQRWIELATNADNGALLLADESGNVDFEFDNEPMPENPDNSIELSKSIAELKSGESIVEPKVETIVESKEFALTPQQCAEIFEMFELPIVKEHIFKNGKTQTSDSYIKNLTTEEKYNSGLKYLTNLIESKNNE